MKHIRRSKLATRIFLLFFVAALLPLLLMAIVTYCSFSASLQQHIQNKLIAISDGRQVLLEQMLDSISAFISERASGPTPVTAFAKLNTAFKKTGIQSKEYKLLDLQYRGMFQKYFDANDYLFDMLFISEDGNIIFSMRHEDDFGANINGPALKNTALSDLVNSVNVHLSTATSDFNFYPPSNEPALFVASPIFGKNRLLGTMVFQVRAEFLYEFARNYVGLPKSGDIVFGKRVGDEFVFTTPTRFMADAAFSMRGKLGSNIAVPMQKAVAGESGIGMALDYRGKTVLSRWGYIPQLRWGMVVKADADEIFRPLYQLRTLYIIIFCVLTSFVLAVAIVVSRNISNPIKMIRDGLNIIGKGNLGHRINLGRDDEIGELSDDVDSMSESLRTVTTSRDKLEKEIAKRKEVQDELEKLNQFFVGRELKMIDLKKEIENLEKKLRQN